MEKQLQKAVKRLSDANNLLLAAQRAVTAAFNDLERIRIREKAMLNKQLWDAMIAADPNDDGGISGAV